MNSSTRSRQITCWHSGSRYEITEVRRAQPGWRERRTSAGNSIQLFQGPSGRLKRTARVQSYRACTISLPECPPPMPGTVKILFSNSQLETRRDWNSNCVLITRSSSVTPRGKRLHEDTMGIEGGLTSCLAVRNADSPRGTDSTIYSAAEQSDVNIRTAYRHASAPAGPAPARYCKERL